MPRPRRASTVLSSRPSGWGGALVVLALSLAPTGAWASPDRGPDALSQEPVPSAILGGDVVNACAWPTAVSVGGYCTGSLIHPQVVMYAAHCGELVPYIRFTDVDEDGPNRNYLPTRCEVHPVGTYGFGTDFAYCILPEPVEDVPIIPPLMGCEAEQMLTVGQDVTLVGFGDDDMDVNGIKRYVHTTITDFSWDEVFIGNSEEGACYGDSGGPALVQLDDGSWRVFGVASWGKPGCGAGTYYSIAHNGVEWIEDASGIDVTPCHDARGGWDPGPSCNAFAQTPEVGGGAWPDGCSFGDKSGYGASCGEPFDPDLTDETPPVITIASPGDRTRHNAPDLMGNVILEALVEATDDGWGTERVVLEIFEGDTVEDAVFELDDDAAPFVFPALTFKTGVWTLRARATDRAGNEAESAPAVFAVNMDPPPAPVDDSSSTGTGDDTTGDETSEVGTDTSDTTVDGGGCSVTTERPGVGALVLLALLGLRRRRRATSWAAAAALPLALTGCGDDTTPAPTDTGTSTDATTATDPGETTEPGTTTETEPPVPACGNGQIEGEELCDDGNEVMGDGCNVDCTPSGSVIWTSFVPREKYGIEGIHDMEFAGNGDIVAAGHARGEKDDIWIGRFDPEGRLLWQTLHDEAGENDSAQSIAVAQDGSIFAAGFASPDDEHSTLWLAQYSEGGDELWARLDQDGVDYDAYWDLSLDSDGDPILFGIRGMGPGETDVTFARKTDATGEPTWTHDLPEDVRGGAATVMADDGVLIVSRAIVDGDDTEDIWLRKLHKNGSEHWTHQYGHALTTYYSHDVSVASDGTIIVCGELRRTNGVDTVVSSYAPDGASQNWIIKLDTAGQLGDACLQTRAAEDGTIAIAGFALLTHPLREMRVAKLEAATGEILWKRTFGAEKAAHDVAETVLWNDDGTLLVGGYMYNLDSSSTDAALVKLTP